MNAKLYIARRESKLKQSDVAKMIGIHPQSYYLKENGKRDFTMTEAKRLTIVFGRTLNDLFED